MGRVNENGKRRRAGSALSLGGLDKMRLRSNSETKHRDMIKIVKRNSRPKGKSINQQISKNYQRSHPRP